MTARPSSDEYGEYFTGYIALVPEEDIAGVLEEQLSEFQRVVRAVAPDRERFRYAPGKWTIRQVFGHLIDAERVFAYRALCISRGETVSLPSFDENLYVAESHYEERPLENLMGEFTDLRRANLRFWKSLNDMDWYRRGIAGGNSVSVRALAFITAGHVRHHFQGLRERYGVSPS